MANYLKINKKPGWVAPLLFKADVNFSQFSNLVFGSCFTGRMSAIPAPQNPFESTQFSSQKSASNHHF